MSPRSRVQRRNRDRAGAGALAVALAACAVTPAGYYFPRHTLVGGGPAARAEGTLTVDQGCIRLNHDELLIWPQSFSVSGILPDVEISGDGIDVHAGDAIAVVGGQYTERFQLPQVAREALAVPCSPPYWLVVEMAFAENS